MNIQVLMVWMLHLSLTDVWRVSRVRCGIKRFVKQSSWLSSDKHTQVASAYFWLFVEAISACLNVIIIPQKWSRKFPICSLKMQNPIFPSYVTRPNLRLQFAEYDSVNGVTGHNACTVLWVILTDNDPIAKACERASYLWMCELYINEVGYDAVWKDHCTYTVQSAVSQRLLCFSVNRHNIRGNATHCSTYCSNVL